MKPHKQQGVAAVEMAVILLPMLILCFGITEVGRALYCYNGLVKSVRGAARYLSTQDLTSATAASIRDNAIRLAYCGALDCSNVAPLVPGLTLAQISVCDRLNCATTHSNIAVPNVPGGSVNLVSVKIGGAGADPYSFTSIVPWVVPTFAFGPVTNTMASQF